MGGVGGCQVGRVSWQKRSWNALGAWEEAIFSHDFGASETSRGDGLPVDTLSFLTSLLAPSPGDFASMVRAFRVRLLGGVYGVWYSFRSGPPFGG